MTKWHMLYIFNTVLYSRNFIYFGFFFLLPKHPFIYIYSVRNTSISTKQFKYVSQLP